MQKKVYQTDSDGLYLYESIANELAMTPGRFNVPFGAYEDAPARKSGKWPRRVGGAWVMVEDYRTTPLWVVETGESRSALSMMAWPEKSATRAGASCLPG